MKDSITFRPIAYIRSDFPSKFGIPRQSGLAGTRAEIVFEPEYRNVDAFRGIEDYSHLWLIWEFSETILKRRTRRRETSDTCGTRGMVGCYCSTLPQLDWGQDPVYNWKH